jgi:hypothetical protein
LIQIQTDRKHLIFERVGIKPEVKREKRGRRRKKSLLTRATLAGRSQCAACNGSAEADVWLSRDITQRCAGVSHTLTGALRTGTTFDFQIIFNIY